LDRTRGGGRPPIPLERMLRIYFLQLWFNLSDPAVEEALYDSVAMRAFVGIDLGAQGAPDETTVCKFRHLLERNKLGKVLLTAVNDHLHRSGIKIAKGTIVDATIIGSPSSTKNKNGERDPEMHQTAKGQQWYFGMKAHVGVDSKTKVIHTVLASAAHVQDRDALPYLLHDAETRVWGGQGHAHLFHRHAPRAKDFTNKRYRFNGRVNEVEKAKNRSKSRVRAKVEHVFGVIKNIFGFRKVRYRGLAKNLHQLKVTAALTNLYIVRRRLLRA
jgi:IS5 family transposase